MIIDQIVGDDETNPIYAELARSNGIRHYNFLESIITASLDLNRSSISEELIKAINYHAIACLHEGAGEYRKVAVTAGDFVPMKSDKVPTKMNKLIEIVNNIWETMDSIALASYLMWGINHIHPFINGNGRTARAMCHYVLCMKSRTRLGINFPEILRTKYRWPSIVALKKVDASLSKENLIYFRLQTSLMRY